MVSLQIISKLLATGDNSIVEDNLLTEDYFEGYKEEFNFIENHYKEYGNIPDKATFLSKFPNIELVEVEESDKYLIDTLKEEYLYYKSVPIVQKIAELLKTDANAAAEYMINATKTLSPNYNLGGTNIISQAIDRYEEFISRKDNQNDWYFTSGFEELDDLIHGIQRGEELVVLFARVNQGKSWISEKITTHIWQLGFNVGYISPEMSASSIGYRFDTLYNNYSNHGLMWGKGEIDEEKYKAYIEKLSCNTHKFIVATPLDFNKKITVSKIKKWIEQYKLDFIAIDGITYLTDERFKRGDNKTTTLTNISEDLMGLSMELKIPILVVVQANRQGVSDQQDGTPELETIRDSDGISHNASKVISIRQLADNVLELGIKKQRFGPVGGKLKYVWDIDTGTFTWLPSTDDATPKETKTKAIESVRKKYEDKTDVF
jgi:replicative DNA helicase